MNTDYNIKEYLKNSVKTCKAGMKKSEIMFRNCYIEALYLGMSQSNNLQSHGAGNQTLTDFRSDIGTASTSAASRSEGVNEISIITMMKLIDRVKSCIEKEGMFIDPEVTLQELTQLVTYVSTHHPEFSNDFRNNLYMENVLKSQYGGNRMITVLTAAYKIMQQACE